ncbi:hypothetical protein BaRGS_00013198 [Batillaria attramentaria]|uniref:Uncharacterized protein n=1 Tax=Batillaria attramentaria TaxID=370345 RepID=A0ABD0L839_9CAEN
MTVEFGELVNTANFLLCVEEVDTKVDTSPPLATESERKKKGKKKKKPALDKVSLVQTELVGSSRFRGFLRCFPSQRLEYPTSIFAQCSWWRRHGRRGFSGTARGEVWLRGEAKAGSFSLFLSNACSLWCQSVDRYFV